MRIKDMVKYVITQFCVITVGILFVSGVANLILSQVRQETVTYSANYPLLVVFTGLISALPSFLLWFKEEPTKRQCHIRMFLHFAAVELIVMVEGFFLGWYRDGVGAVILFVIIFLVYLLVYVHAYFTNKDTADAINEALQRFHNEEDDGEIDPSDPCD